MGSEQKNKAKQRGVSIITCTKRHNFINNLFQNYIRQRHPKKELIIIVNNDSISLEPYQRLARKNRGIQVYRVAGRESLGACLNYAFSKTKYSYIAKFDDDDYYAPYYLKDSLQALQKANADVVGKRAHYMYLNGAKTLILRFHQDENRPVAKLPGATLFMKRNVLNKVRFPHQNVGEDDLFCLRSKKQGYKVYSAGRYNFVAIRRKNSAGHTWIISDKKLLSHHKRVPNVQNFKKFVQRTPRDAP